MTTAAMVFGVVPLILATGAGAMSRFDMMIAADHSRQEEPDTSPTPASS